jgi:cytoskeletal protein CcmA (bactofilin family)
MATLSSSWQKLEIGRRLTRQDATAAGTPETPVAEDHTACIQEGCEVEGRLALENSIRIQGEFRGRIEAGNTVTVDERATVTGDIQARTVIIYGAVAGNIDASREVVIRATGRLHGNVKTPAFEVARGAFFSGRTKMYRPERVVHTPTSAHASTT